MAKGTKLPPPPKMPTKMASAAGTKRTQESEPGNTEDNIVESEARPKKAMKTAAAQRKLWEKDSDSENLDTDMPDFS